MEPFRNKTDIFFDLDHTLWDFEKNSALAFEAIFNKHNIDLKLDLFLENYIPVNLKYWKLYRENKISPEALRYHRLREVFEGMSVEADDELIYLLSSEYIHYLPQFNYLYEGTHEILEYLIKRYRLHIITNGFAHVQFGKLKNAGIDRYFQTVVNSEMAGVKKPSPYIFELALELAGTSKEKSVMVGDNWEADIEGAMNVGIDVIFFNENRSLVGQPIRQVERLEQIKMFL